MTTRRSFLKLFATALGSLLPLHLLPRGITKYFDGEVGQIIITHSVEYLTEEESNQRLIDLAEDPDWVKIDIDGEFIKESYEIGEFLKTLDCPFEIKVIPPSIEVDRP